jgi:hypothetical protein
VSPSALRALAGRNQSHKSSKPTHRPILSEILRIAIPCNTNDCVFLTNDPGMSMKTNSRGVEELWGQFKRLGRMLTVCRSLTLDSRPLDLNSTEQSENVYENKRSGS